MSNTQHVQTGFAEINGTTLYYEDAGAGHPFVLVHGHLLDRRSWDDQFVIFAQRYRVIRYDQRAYIEVDTRITRALCSALPLLWDYTTEYGQDARFDAFLDDSLAHGVGSGLIFGLHGSRGRAIYQPCSFRRLLRVSWVRQRSFLSPCHLLLGVATIP